MTQEQPYPLVPVKAVSLLCLVAGLVFLVKELPSLLDFDSLFSLGFLGMLSGYSTWVAESNREER